MKVPHNLELEKAVLGLVLANPSLIDEAQEFLRERDFHSTANRLIFKEMVADGQQADAVLLCESLKSKGLLDQAGGVEYVGGLFKDSAPVLSSVKPYCLKLADLSAKRRLMIVCQDIACRCGNGEESAEELIEVAETGIFEVSRDRFGGGFTSAQEILLDVHARISEANRNPVVLLGVSTGFPSLDHIFRLKDTELVLIAGRPGMGKTSLGLDIARHCAVRQNRRVGILSLEMNRQAVMARMVCQEAEFNSQELHYGRLSNADWSKVTKAMAELSKDGRLHVDDSPAVSPGALRSKSRRLKARIGLDLLIVDYIQLMIDPAKRRETRQLEVAAISRALKLLAMELRIPVVALSQLNREVERRNFNRKPRLSDLRESGSLEQDADIVAAIHRESAEDTDGSISVEYEASILVLKNRNGPTGSIKLDFMPHCTSFREQNS